MKKKFEESDEQPAEKPVCWYCGEKLNGQGCRCDRTYERQVDK